jgi:hypothetical protein
MITTQYKAENKILRKELNQKSDRSERLAKELQTLKLNYSNQQVILILYDTILLYHYRIRILLNRLSSLLLFDLFSCYVL